MGHHRHFYSATHPTKAFLKLSLIFEMRINPSVQEFRRTRKGIKNKSQFVMNKFKENL